MTGVIVSKINPLSDAYKILKKDDIILSFDGVLLANDGTGVFFLFCFLNFHLYIFYCIDNHQEVLTKCGSDAYDMERINMVATI